MHPFYLSAHFTLERQAGETEIEALFLRILSAAHYDFVPIPIALGKVDDNLIARF